MAGAGKPEVREHARKEAQMGKPRGKEEQEARGAADPEVKVVGGTELGKASQDPQDTGGH